MSREKQAMDNNPRLLHLMKSARRSSIAAQTRYHNKTANLTPLPSTASLPQPNAKGYTPLNNLWHNIWSKATQTILGRKLKMPVSPQFITYTLIGGFSVLTDMVSFVILFTVFKTSLVNIVSYLIGTFVSFFLNRTLNFNVTNRTGTRLLRFILVSIGGILWSTALIHMLSFNMPAWIAKIITLPLVLIYQYLLSKKWVYAKG